MSNSTQALNKATSILKARIVANTPKVTESGGASVAAVGAKASVGYNPPPLEIEEPAMRLNRTPSGPLLRSGEDRFTVPALSWYELLNRDEPLPDDTPVQLQIRRDGRVVVDDRTVLSLMKRSPAELVEYLTRESTFPDGCFLMTGTGIVPDEHFSLAPGDEVRITIPPIGTLVNYAAHATTDEKQRRRA